MIHVQFTYALKRFFPDLSNEQINANNLHQLLDSLEQIYPGLKTYILEDHGSMRKHVNIFINGQMIEDRRSLEHDLRSGDQVYIMQALSGG